MKDQMKTTTYDEAYFDGGKGYSTYQDNERYLEQAKKIIEWYSPKNVLDIGCAKGFLVNALRSLDIPTWGIDISEYAIATSHAAIQDFVFEYDVTSGRDIQLPHFDLIVSFDTFEHLPEDKLDLVKMFMLQHGSRYHIQVGTINTPDWQHDATHITIKPIEWWREWWEQANFEESI